MALTPQSHLRHLILVVLSSYEEGRRTRGQVLKDIDEAYHAEWSDEDRAGPATEPNKVNWQVRASFERAAMVRDKLLADDADGYWTLTAQGWAAASDATAGTIAATGKLAKLTEPTAVETALEEFRSMGRENFLALYGLERSRDYFVRVGNEMYDSKPIVSVAYKVQHPAHGPLPVSDFSGGTDGAVRTLERLGFEVVTRAQLAPPTLGDEYASRTDIYEAFGGDKVAGIIRFPGEHLINIFSDAEGPYADDPPLLTEAFGYRGEGLRGPQRLSQRGNALMEAARKSRVRVRFWYRPVGEPFSFLTWAVVLGRAWVSGTGEDGVARPELEWRLIAVPSSSTQLPPAVTAQIDESPEDEAKSPEAKLDVTYSELVGRVDQLGQRPTKDGKSRPSYARSAAARRAVLIRSNGKCESVRCTGMPVELTRKGNPILDVDHVRDLGLGGPDHPSNMVALCPNCHACKTRGLHTARWRRELLKVAAEAHAAALA